MATTSAAPQSPATGGKPEIKRVQQSNDFDCAFACIAMVTNKPLAEIRQVAIDKFKLPAHGPYWINEELITKLFAHYSWVGTLYKEAGIIGELPDLALLMIDYNPETEIGRHVLFQRQRGAAGKPSVETIIDPAFWIEPSKQIRTDVKNLPPPFWYIGLHPMRPEGK